MAINIIETSIGNSLVSLDNVMHAVEKLSELGSNYLLGEYFVKVVLLELVQWKTCTTLGSLSLGTEKI